MIQHGAGAWLLDDSGMMLWSLIIGIIGAAVGALSHKLLSPAKKTEYLPPPPEQWLE